MKNKKILISIILIIILVLACALNDVRNAMEHITLLFN